MKMLGSANLEEQTIYWLRDMGSAKKSGLFPITLLLVNCLLQMNCNVTPCAEERVLKRLRFFRDDNDTGTNVHPFSSSCMLNIGIHGQNVPGNNEDTASPSCSSEMAQQESSSTVGYGSATASLYSDLGDCAQICEYCGAHFWFVLRDTVAPVLKIDYEKSYTVAVEKLRNRYTLAELLAQNPARYMLKQVWNLSTSKRTKKVLLPKTSRKMLRPKTQTNHDKKKEYSGAHFFWSPR